jgi:membrane protein
VLWIAGSVGFSLYVNFFGNYKPDLRDVGRGHRAHAVAVPDRLHRAAGAEINAESERQTARDTTRGEPPPMGRRRAQVADSLAEPPG